LSRERIRGIFQEAGLIWLETKVRFKKPAMIAESLNADRRYARHKAMIAGLILLFFLSVVGICSASDYSKTPVFFIHGHECSAGDFVFIINELEKSGYPRSYLKAIQLTPDNGANIEAAELQIAPAIENFLTGINSRLKKTKPSIPPKTKIDLVSHSMGALSARWYAARIRPDRVRVWLSLAGASHGTDVLCGFKDPGSRDLCPAYAGSDRESRIQYALNGDPRVRDADETPYGVGKDAPGVNVIRPERSRNILYISIRTTPDRALRPESSPILDGAGGAIGLLPSGVPAEETSPGNILMKNRTGHDEMLSDAATIHVVRSILERADTSLK
jgi:pimeloyl-ACP methyl ester carboxylesterase